MLLKYSILISILIIFTLISCAKLKTDVGVCDLLDNPDAYSDRVVRVKGNYKVGFEWAYISCAECAEGERIWVNYAGLSEEEIEKIGKQIDRDSPYDDVIANVIFVGKLKTNGLFGHMGGYKHLLEVQKVERLDVLYKGKPFNDDDAEKESEIKAKAKEFCKFDNHKK